MSLSITITILLVHLRNVLADLIMLSVAKSVVHSTQFITSPQKCLIICKMTKVAYLDNICNCTGQC